MAAYRLKDYGGNMHGTSSTGLYSTSSKHSRSMICDECKKLQYYPHIAFTRKAMPRCYHCGGMLIETEEGFKKRTGKTKKATAKVIELGCPGVKPYVCLHCSQAFRSQTGMKLHIRDNHEEDE
jgi:hypothetical protein